MRLLVLVGWAGEWLDSLESGGIHAGVTLYFSPVGGVGILVWTRREVSQDSRAVGRELTDESVGAAHGIVCTEFQRDFSVVREMDLREIAIVLI